MTRRQFHNLLNKMESATLALYQKTANSFDAQEILKEFDKVNVLAQKLRENETPRDFILVDLSFHNTVIHRGNMTLSRAEEINKQMVKDSVPHKWVEDLSHL